MTGVGTLLGEGRTAQVFAYGPGTVVKLLRPGFPDTLAELEARGGSLIAAAYPAAPRCLGLVRIGGRPGVEYERIDGPSMDDLVRRRLWELDRRARELGVLHAGMHAIRGAGLPTQRLALHAAIERAGPYLEAEAVEAIHTRVEVLPAGSSLCHGDLHPGNVLIADRLVIIDWENATSGNPAADVARSLFLVAEASTSRDDGVLAPIAPSIRGRFARTYLAAYRRERALDVVEVAAWRLPIMAARLAEAIVEEREGLLREIDAELASGRLSPVVPS